jgi:hypothetical protein
VFQIMDTHESNKLFRPVKSGFLTAAQAYRWAKKHLPKDSCSEWGKIKYERDRYFIKSY